MEIKGETMALVVLEGSRILTEGDFHQELSGALDFGPFYGSNLDALWDRLRMDVERPVKLVWKDSALSKEHLGDDFNRIVDILEKAQDLDRQLNRAEQFEFELA
jgi:ribonuclease inhibitor